MKPLLFKGLRQNYYIVDLCDFAVVALIEPGLCEKSCIAHRLNFAAVNSSTNHLRCIVYAIKTIFRVLPALGRSTDHVDPPPGLGIQHFAIAGVICTVLLVGTIITVVSVILKLVIAK